MSVSVDRRGARKQVTKEGELEFLHGTGSGKKIRKGDRTAHAPTLVRAKMRALRATRPAASAVRGIVEVGGGGFRSKCVRACERVMGLL